MNTPQITREKHARHIAAVHRILCHSDGSKHIDGCDKAADPKLVARYERGDFDKAGA